MNFIKESTTKETIYQTTDYDKFHFIKGNRPVKPGFVEKLAARMHKEGFLKDRAIDINPDMGIADGQHRFLAAKLQGIPLYYRILEKPVSIRSIQGRNIMIPWSAHDYLNSYIELGDKRYVELKNFADEYRLSIAISFQILSKAVGLGNSRNVLEAMRQDKFEIPDYAWSERLASLVSEVRQYTPDNAFSHRACIRALAILMEKVDPKLLFNQLKRYQQVITRRVSVKDYLLEFENILNQGNTEKPIRLT